MKLNEKKNKHLTQEDRSQIEECLGKRMSFKDIGRLIGKDPTTVSYEVKHHRQEHSNSYTNCREVCPCLLKAPFVCNGCSKKHSSACHYIHYLYRSVPAQSEYKTLLSEAREGIPLNKQSFYETESIIADALKKGQHIYHIIANNPKITCSQSSVYRYIQKGYYTISLLELPRKVKFKPRHSRKEQYIPKGIKVGRSHDDYLSYVDNHHLERHTELDTVIGEIGGKVIETIHFTAVNFMIGLLLDNKTSAEAAAAFADLKDKIRSNGFSVRETFDVLLADNGGEFADVFSFENDRNNIAEINMFYCDPMTPSQKPQIEKNHTLFRDIVPKATSFNNFTQETVNLIFSHVNSVSRPLYGGKSAYDMFSFVYSEKLASLLGITRIPPENVIQSPLLLKHLADQKKNH